MVTCLDLNFKLLLFYSNLIPSPYSGTRNEKHSTLVATMEVHLHLNKTGGSVHTMYYVLYYRLREEVMMAIHFIFPCTKVKKQPWYI